MKRTRATAAAAVLACGALLTGCGGGGEDATSQQAPAAATDAAAPASEESASAYSFEGKAVDKAGVTVNASKGNSANAATAAAPAGEAALAADAAAGAGGANAPKAATGTRAGSAVSAKIAEGAGKAAFKTAAPPNAALANRDLIYTADMTVRAKDVEKAASQIESAADAAGGIVVNSTRNIEPGAETLGSDGKIVKAPDRPSATLKLRVPPGDFDDVLARIARTGEVLDRTLTGKDVTAEVVDVKSRIASQRKSVERIRDLMDKATTLRDIVNLESEVAQREAELEALLAKQAKLADQTALATITVRVVPKVDESTPAIDRDTREAGFVSGLHDGWDAFVAAMVVAATVLGALLPFAVVLLVLGPPVTWFVLRVRRSVADGKPAT